MYLSSTIAPSRICDRPCFLLSWQSTVHKLLWRYKGYKSDPKFHFCVAGFQLKWRRCYPEERRHPESLLIDSISECRPLGLVSFRLHNCSHAALSCRHMSGSSCAVPLGPPEPAEGPGGAQRPAGGHSETRGGWDPGWCPTSKTTRSLWWSASYLWMCLADLCMCKNIHCMYFVDFFL